MFKVECVCLLILSSLFTSALADDVSSLIITKTDGQQTGVALTSIRSIKFSDDQMIINTNGSTMCVAVSDITSVTFGSLATAIQTVAGSEGTTSVLVTDLDGKIVYQGTSMNENIPAGLKGVYVITTGGVSKKVTIK